MITVVTASCRKVQVKSYQLKNNINKIDSAEKKKESAAVATDVNNMFSHPSTGKAKWQERLSTFSNWTVTIPKHHTAKKVIVL